MPLFSRLGFIIIFAIVCMASNVAFAQSIRGDKHDGKMFSRDLSNPIIKQNLHVKARHASSWETEGTTIIWLKDYAQISLAGYGFKASEAVLAVKKVATEDGEAYHIRLCLNKASQTTQYLAIRQRADFLLVSAAFDGKLILDCAKLESTDMSGNPFVEKAYERFRLLNSGKQVTQAGILDKPLNVARRGADDPNHLWDEKITAVNKRGENNRVTEGTKPGVKKVGQGIVYDPDVTYKGDDPKLQAKPTLFFSADKVQNVPTSGASYLVMVGSIKLMYYEAGTNNTRTIRADKAVIFGKPGAFSGIGGTIAPENVTGIYLEDNVIIKSDEYTLRGPRAFYELGTDRAVMLNAVLYTWDKETNLPLYVRANSLKQKSKTSWKVKDAKLTTSEFGTPHFAIGMSELTIDRVEREGRPAKHHFVSKNNTIEVMDVPIFFLPVLWGVDDSPLQEVEVTNENGNGTAVKTTFGLFELLGIEKPIGVEAVLKADAYIQRGVGIGVEGEYDLPSAYGNVTAYGLFQITDDGGDPYGFGRDQDPDSVQGMIYLQHRQFVARYWELTAQLAYVSTPPLLAEFFRDRSVTDQTWETSIEGKYQRDDTIFNVLIKYDATAFIPQVRELLESPYTIDKYPEIGYYRIGTDLFGGRLTWYSDNTVTAFSVRASSESPEDYGFRDQDAIEFFNITNQTSFEDGLLAVGIDDDVRARFDSRQEIQLPSELRLGSTVINTVPYLTVRVTAYDDDFEDYSPDSDQVRLWGGAGVRFQTAFHSVYGFRNDLLDINGLQHIIEPSIDIHIADSTVERGDNPIFEPDIEGISEGWTIKIGLLNILKTKRGEPGQRVITDLLRVDMNLVLTQDSSNQDSRAAYYFGYRPEYSINGNHFDVDAAWQVTSTLVATGGLFYDCDDEMFQTWHFGILHDHNPRLRSSLYIRRSRPFGSLVLKYGIQYRIDRYYDVQLSQSFDMQRSENRRFRIRLTRHLPQWALDFNIVFDPVENQNSFTINLRPTAKGGAFQGVGGKPSDNDF